MAGSLGRKSVRAVGKKPSIGGPDGPLAPWAESSRCIEVQGRGGVGGTKWAPQGAKGYKKLVDGQTVGDVGEVAVAGARRQGSRLRVEMR